MPILLSVIIPCLNEETALSELLQDLQKQSFTDFEIIIADGGSKDKSIEIAKKYSCKILHCPKGRGKQLNFASKEAKGSYFLFLHADTRIPQPECLKDSLNFFRNYETKSSKKILGHFSLSFYGKEKGRETTYRYHEEKTYMNRPNTTNGDQGTLIHSQNFDAFSEKFHFLEDQEFVERFRKYGSIITLPFTLQTSARRLEAQGANKTFILMSIIMGCFSCGLDRFITDSKDVYLEQKEAKELQLFPFFQLAWSVILRDYTFFERIKKLYQIGKYIRSNSWQLFYWFDINISHYIKRNSYIFLKFHDKIFAPITNFRFCDAIVGLLCFIWFLLILPTYFFLTETR